MVDKLSALTGLENERLFPVTANHRTMCKIPSYTSYQYRVVGSWIAKLAKQVLLDPIVQGKICMFIKNIN